jgi:uncharacterized OB-fold protein
VSDAPAKPVPQLRGEELAFFAAAAEGRLAIQRCPECDEAIFFPRTVCPRCRGGTPEWVDAAGTGTVYSFSVVERSALPGFADEVPYVVALVELREGVRLMANVVNVPPDRVRIGMPVRVTFERRRTEVGEELTVPQFEPAEAAEAMA